MRGNRKTLGFIIELPESDDDSDTEQRLSSQKTRSLASAPITPIMSTKKQKSQQDLYRLFAARPKETDGRLEYVSENLRIFKIRFLLLICDLIQAVKNNIDSSGFFSSESLIKMTHSNSSTPSSTPKQIATAVNLRRRSTILNPLSATNVSSYSLSSSQSASSSNKPSSINELTDLATSSANLFYGTTICLQSSAFDNYLSFETEYLRASSTAPDMHTKLKLSNSLNSIDNDSVKYGDMVYLQVGTDHIVGTSFIMFENDLDSRRLCEGGHIYPILIRISKLSESRLKDADNFGRWKVLHKNRKKNTIGEAVFNKDEVVYCKYASTTTFHNYYYYDIILFIYIYMYVLDIIRTRWILSEQSKFLEQL